MCTHTSNYLHCVCCIVILSATRSIKLSHIRLLAAWTCQWPLWNKAYRYANAEVTFIQQLQHYTRFLYRPLVINIAPPTHLPPSNPLLLLLPSCSSPHLDPPPAHVTNLWGRHTFTWSGGYSLFLCMFLITCVTTLGGGVFPHVWMPVNILTATKSCAMQKWHTTDKSTTIEWIFRIYQGMAPKIFT